MSDSLRARQHFRGVAFVGTYLPRRCGIATFTHDLAEAVEGQIDKNQQVLVAAMNDRQEGYAYPDRVKFEIRQDYQIDYSKAADFLNFSRIDVVSVQHEYRIFGSNWGSNILTFLRDLHRPAVVTCHTVYKDPLQEQLDIFKEIAARAHKLVVMSSRAVDMLEEIYGIGRDKVALIPHGIHDTPFVDPNYYKDKFSVEGRQMLLTFGLLHRNKGIEYMIEALPKIVERHPATVYVVLGTTHPAIVRQEGEAYRQELQRRVRELRLEDHVVFHHRFVESEDLLEYIGAADILVTPYLTQEYITSGVLSFGMGMGKAVVSTPYWHAEEALTDDRGRLVPIGDSDALANEVNELLDDVVTMSKIRKRAYKYSRDMVWSKVARSYLKLFDEVRSHVPAKIVKSSLSWRPIAATNVPLPSLDHLIRLSDDTGPCRYARHTLPDWSFGYTMEDTAAAIVATTKYYDIFSTKESSRLAETYLTLMQNLVGDGSDPAAGLTYTRNPSGSASPIALCKAIWALGYLLNQGPSHLKSIANDLFLLTLQCRSTDDPRAAAHAVLGAANYFIHFQGASEAKRFLSKTARCVEKFCKASDWIERWPGADWGVAAQALIIASEVLEDSQLAELTYKLIADLCEATSDGTIFLRPGENPEEEELPVSAATFIEALGAAFFAQRDRDLLIRIRAAADWFLGTNRLGEPLYDFSTSGCHDALTATGLNTNQGTEATVYCLLAFLTLHRLAVANTPDSASLFPV